MLLRCMRCWSKERLLKCKNDDCPNFLCPAHSNHGGCCTDCWETGCITLPPWPLAKLRRR